MTHEFTFAQLMKLEGLLHSLGQARDRKRKGLTIHQDELPGMIEALTPAVALMQDAWEAHKRNPV